MQLSLTKYRRPCAILDLYHLQTEMMIFESECVIYAVFLVLGNLMTVHQINIVQTNSAKGTTYCGIKLISFKVKFIVTCEVFGKLFWVLVCRALRISSK